MTEATQERVPVQDMTDRQIAEETLILLRAFQDAFMAVAGNPMMAAMIPASLQR